MSTTLQRESVSTWKKVTTGVLRNGQHALSELTACNLRTGELGKNILTHARYDHHPREVELVQLWFPEGGGTTAAMHQTARNHQLTRCSPEEAIMLFLQHREVHKWTHVPRMRIPILDSKDDNLYFTLEAGELWTRIALPRMGWDNSIPWVFAKSRY